MANQIEVMPNIVNAVGSMEEAMRLQELDSPIRNDTVVTNQEIDQDPSERTSTTLHATPQPYGGHCAPYMFALFVVAAVYAISYGLQLRATSSGTAAPCSAPTSRKSALEMLIDATPSGSNDARWKNNSTSSSARSPPVLRRRKRPTGWTSRNVLKVPLSRQAMEMNSATGGNVYYRNAYSGTLSLGWPPQNFTAVFDTGSGHLLLPSGYCHSETCHAHKRYRRSASRSAKDIDHDGTEVAAGVPRDQITVAFGTGTVTGVFVEDLVCLGDAGVSTEEDALAIRAPGPMPPVLPKGCMNLRFIAATQMSEHPFKSFRFDGVLGLGLDALSQTPEFNFLNVIARSAGLHGGEMPHTFGVFLADSPGQDSEIAFGGWNEERMLEDLVWSPVYKPEHGHWLINVRRVRVDGQIVDFCEDGSCRAVVDTGTSLLALPSKVFPELYNLLRHPAPRGGQCRGRGPQLHIELDDYTITLGPKDYARLEQAPPLPANKWGANASAVSDTKNGRQDLRCKPQLMVMDLPAPMGPKLFILGEPVLRKYYSVYDAKEQRVGFALASHYQRASQQIEEMLFDDDDVNPSEALQEPGSMFDVFRHKKMVS